MSVKFRAFVLVGLVILLAVVLVGSNSRAAAQSGGDEPTVTGSRTTQANSIDTVPGGPGFASLPGGAFTASTNLTQWGLFGGFELYNPSATVDGAYVAPVLLPDGATLLKLVVFFYDNVDENLTVGLYCMDTNGFNVVSLANVSSNGNSGYGYSVDGSLKGTRVDNQNCAYMAMAELPSDKGTLLALFSIRIDYGYSDFLPVIID